MTARVGPWILGGLLVASAFALGVTKVQDSDAWTHLALGREMVSLRSFPQHEPFSFPSGGMPYYNTEWLFDVVIYLTYLGAGLAGVILLKAAIIALLSWILWKDSTLPDDPESDRTLRLAIAAAVLLPVMLAIRHRFVERPDIALMVFIAFTIYALNAYLYEGRRYLYVLPAVQVLWVNIHPTAILSLGPFLAVLGGGMLLRWIHRWRGVEPPGTPSAAQLKTVTLIFAAVIIASFLNPYGSDAVTLPFRLAASPWFTQQIVELQPPHLAEHPVLFGLMALLALTFIVLVRHLPVVSVLLVAPFAYLGLSAVRSISLFGIVAAPVLVRNLSLIARPLNPGWARRLALGVALAGILAGVVTTGLTLARVEPFADSRQVTGIGVNSQYVPEGAFRYLDRLGVTGKIFNAFHWGGYVVWRDFPRRVPIIDGRGYVPPGLLEEIYFARVYPQELERLQATYGFDVAVVDYPVYTSDTLEEAKPDADFALPSPQWVLVYWDDVALVYLRRTERFATIIARDQYRHVKPANGALFLSRTLADRSAFAAIDAEIRRNIAETQSSVGYALLGFAAFEVGAFDAAIEAFNHVRGGPMLHEAYQGLALAHWRKGNMAQAIEYYRKVLRVKADPIWLYNTGLALLETGNYREAIDYLERARRKDPQFAPVYPALIDAYRRTGTAAGREPELAVAYASAVTLSRAEEHARRALQLDREGRSAEAVAELRASLQLNPRNAKAASNLGVIYFNLGWLDDALVQQKTALTLDANFANAHYGLAMIYQRRGDQAAARRHFEEFMRLEPRSYFAWRVREDLSQLAR